MRDQHIISLLRILIIFFFIIIISGSTDLNKYVTLGELSEKQIDGAYKWKIYP